MVNSQLRVLHIVFGALVLGVAAYAFYFAIFSARRRSGFNIIVTLASLLLAISLLAISFITISGKLMPPTVEQRANYYRFVNCGDVPAMAVEYFIPATRGKVS